MSAIDFCPCSGYLTMSFATVFLYQKNKIAISDYSNEALNSLVSPDIEITGSSEALERVTGNVSIF